MEESKNTELKRIPTKLKDLLGIGLREGLEVSYCRGSKEKQQPDLGLRGVIHGNGILCSCYECRGDRVITPNKFEIHAQSKNKRPPEYIYLGNGKSLRDVLELCKGLIPKASEARPLLLCDACVPNQTAHTATRSPLVDSPSPVPSSDRLADLESDETSCRSQCQTKQRGKLTRRDMRMHKSVFSENVLPDGGSLTYMKDNKVSPSIFEHHAGFGARKRPYMNIFTTSEGVSLHALSLQISKNKIFCVDESDHY